MPIPNQLPKLNFEGVDPVFQQWLNNLTDAVNTHSGYNGPVQYADDLDLAGNRIKNLGPATDETDALSQAVAEQQYSASALQPKLAPGGPYSIVGYRQLGSASQREPVSSFLNDLMSTPPNSNAILPTLTSGVGTVTVSIPASLFQFADGSTLLLQARTDILTVPAEFAISAISCVGNLVSVTCAPSGLVAGQAATITGVTPSSFNGTYPIISSTTGGADLEYQVDLGTVSGAGGFVQVNGVYFYSVAKRSTIIRLFGPYASDTLQNRLQASPDGYQIVAVVTLTRSGGILDSTGGGGSPIVGSPTAGSLF